MLSEDATKKIRTEYDAITLAMRQMEKLRTSLLLRTVPTSEGDRIEYWTTVGSKTFSRTRERRVGIVQGVYLHHPPVSMLPHDDAMEPYWSLRVARINDKNEISRMADSVMQRDFISVIQPSAPELDF